MTPGLLRLINVAIHKFSREPESRDVSSAMLLRLAVRLHAEQTSPGEAALVSAEMLGELVQSARLQQRKAS